MGKFDWGDFVGASYVVNLTDETFESFITQTSAVMTLFYSEDCMYCRKLKPEYSKAAIDLKMKGCDCHLAAVEASRNTISARKYGIAVYPTILLFQNGLFIEKYVGERNSESIASFMMQRFGKNSVK